MTTDTDTFTFSRAFEISPAQLWHIMTDASSRATWGAPDPTSSLTTLQSDFTIGGQEHHCSGPKDAPEFEVKSRWYQISEPTEAVYTEVIEAEGMRLGASLVTFKITETNVGSTLSLTVAVSSFVGPEMIAEFRSGWDSGVQQIETLANA